MTAAYCRQDEERAEANRRALNAAEADFEAAFETLMEYTDIQRCMDSLGRVCEGRAGARRWNERAEMLFDLGRQFQDAGLE